MDIVVSINIYKSCKTLEYQLSTIKEHLKANYIVVLNCNQYMYDTLSQMKLDEIIYLNPEILEKKRYHGSLTQGIISNMKYAVDTFTFKYFVVMSGRTIFYRPITIDNFNTYFEKKKWKDIQEMESIRSGPFPFTDWKWPSLTKTKLAKYYMNKHYTLIGEVHEGLCVSYNVTKNILRFIENNPEITKDLYEFNDCVEEFSIHTIASNEYDTDNLEYGFIYIGNGSCEKCDYSNTDKYTRKILFLD